MVVTVNTSLFSTLLYVIFPNVSPNKNVDVLHRINNASAQLLRFISVISHTYVLNPSSQLHIFYFLLITKVNQA